MLVNDLIAFAKIGTKAAGPLVVAGWGLYALPVTQNLIFPYGAVGSGLALVAIACGVASSSLIVLKVAWRF